MFPVLKFSCLGLAGPGAHSNVGGGRWWSRSVWSLVSICYAKLPFGIFTHCSLKVLSWSFEIIFVLMTSTNLDFGDFEKVIFQVVARHSELIFNLLNSPNSDLSEVGKAMFQVVARLYDIIFCVLTNSKCDLGKFEKAMLQVPHCTFNSFSVSCPVQIAIWVMSGMRCYNWSPGFVNSFSASWPAKNTTW